MQALIQKQFKLTQKHIAKLERLANYHTGGNASEWVRRIIEESPEPPKHKSLLFSPSKNSHALSETIPN